MRFDGDGKIVWHWDVFKVVRDGSTQLDGALKQASPESEIIADIADLGVLT